MTAPRAVLYEPRMVDDKAETEREEAAGCRVVRLEWRVHGPKHVLGYRRFKGSRSLVEAHLKDGRRVRLQKIPPRGLVETILEAGQGSVEGELYRGRVAETDSFERPQLTLDHLRDVAVGVGSSPYCWLRTNSHHFARDLWNALVIQKIRKRRHPGWVRGAVWNVAAADCFTGGDVSDDDRRPTRQGSARKAGRRSPSPTERRPSVSVRDDIGNRLAGEFRSIAGTASGFDGVGRLREFSMTMRSGAVFAIECDHHQVPALQSFSALEDFIKDSPGSSCRSSPLQRGCSGLMSMSTKTPQSADGSPLLGLEHTGEEGTQVSCCSSSTRGSPTSSSPSSKCASMMWPQTLRSTWNKSGLGDLASRLATRVSSTDVSILLRALPSERWAEPSLGSDDEGGHGTATPTARRRALSLSSSMSRSFSRSFSRGRMSFSRQRSSSRGSRLFKQWAPSIEDICFVVLSGAEETRLAIYVVLSVTMLDRDCHVLSVSTFDQEPCENPGSVVRLPSEKSQEQRRRLQRLRLVSGDFHTGQEGSYSYSLSDIPEGTFGGSCRALDLVEAELTELRTAVMTGDWGFITLL